MRWNEVPVMWAAKCGWLMLVMWLLAGSLAPVDAIAQDGASELIERFRTARIQAQLQRIMEQARELARPRPPAPIITEADTLRPWLARRWMPGIEIVVEEEEPEVVFEIDSLRLLGRFEYGWFQRVYEDTRWAYLGRSSTYENPAPIDTSLTQRLRAHLQNYYGDPTYTLVERDERNPSRDGGALQFEYWFVVNDSIPVKIIDPNGPFDRGLVLVGDNRWRDSLRDIRDAMLGEILEKTEPEPYVDYYYDGESNRWYRVGYDGRRYFEVAIRPPNFNRGRPRL